MNYCEIFLEKHFFKKFYLDLDLRRKSSVNKNNPFEGDDLHGKNEEKVFMYLTLYKIRLLDFYTFNKITNIFILLILLMMFIIITFICTSKYRIKKTMTRLKKKADEKEYTSIQN